MLFRINAPHKHTIERPYMRKKSASIIEAADIVMGIGLLAQREFTHHGLSRRQCQIAYRLFQGESGRLIAKRLYITTSCVRYHISKIYAKTSSKNREDFLRTIWKGIHFSKTSWSSKDEMQKDREKRLSEMGEWREC